jgi:hypothetical protein
MPHANEVLGIQERTARLNFAPCLRARGTRLNEVHVWLARTMWRLI